MTRTRRRRSRRRRRRAIRGGWRIRRCGCSAIGRLIPVSGERLARVLRGQPVRAPSVSGQPLGFAVDPKDQVVAVMREDAGQPSRWHPEKVLRGG